MSLVQIGAFESVFCTPSPADVHSRPPHSLEVKKPAEEQPTWSLIWPDIGKWFPMITSRSIWKLWVSLLVQQEVKTREGRHRSQVHSSKKQWWHYEPDLYTIWGSSLCVHICIKPHCFFVFNSFFCHLVHGPDVNIAIRKIATLLKPDKDIIHEGDHIIIKTLSTFKNYNMDFYVGQEFEEDLSGVDDRKCMVRFFPFCT